MSSNNVTFVTSIMQIYDKPYDEKSIEWRFDKFREIAELGIYLCVYVDDQTNSTCIEFAKQYDNIKIINIHNLNNTILAKQCAEIEYNLPEHRSHEKDTANYMLLMNCKFEFLSDAVEKNLWNTQIFAWIDFSITYIFRKPIISVDLLRTLSKRTFVKTPFLTIPGCFEKDAVFYDKKHNYSNDDKIQFMLNSVYWRFCGGFILGDASSIIDTFEKYKKHFIEFITLYGKLVWEVNFWTWLEMKTDWSPIWYTSYHDDNIFKVPVHLYAVNLDEEKTLVKTNYDYPVIENNEPMQCSYVEFEGRHIINTRFVNYRCLVNGNLYAIDGSSFLNTRNIMSILDDRDMKPINYNEMREKETIGLLSNDTASCIGLEDIRLYVHNGLLKYIATNINYSPTGGNHMIVGEYDVENKAYNNSVIVSSPYDNWCEKNWIPIILDEEELFIYKWWPMEIGKINYETKKLEIVKTFDIKSPNFENVRGSTTFTYDNKSDSLIGLVHFSEETSPRRYYHMLVSLDKITLKPLNYSNVFYFQHLGIEFCTGMKICDDGDKYMFWISKCDREPAMVTVNRDRIPLLFDF